MANEKRDLLKRLVKYPVFAKCSKSDVEALVDAGSPFSLPAGWPMVQEGIPADACYVLTDGAALVFHQREQIAELGEGDLVGEMALFGNGRRSATVTSSARVQGLRIENEKLAPVLAEHAALSAAFQAVYEAHGGT